MHNADPELVRRYLDNSATSFPKPKTVGASILRYLDELGGPYGRSAYPQAFEATSIVFEARESLARLLGVSDSSRIALTQNATHGLNLAIQNTARPGGVVLVSPLEHNSVMRPLFLLKEKLGITFETMPHQRDGRILPAEIATSPSVCMAVVNMQSNVNGVIQPIREIKERLGDIPLIVDAAQAAGETPIEAEAWHLDMVACTGHKHLLGPTGTGCLYVRNGMELHPLMPGGTGSNSGHIEHPRAMPDSLESGTQNIAGIAGLHAALSFLQEDGLFDGQHLVQQAIEGLQRTGSVQIYCAGDPAHQGGTFSFNVDSIPCSETARLLSDKFRLAVRAGLHCAPSAHQCLGTYKEGGTVRISFGHFQKTDSVDLLVDAVQSIAAGR